jgi:hypothetical protein
VVLIFHRKVLNVDVPYDAWVDNNDSHSKNWTVYNFKGWHLTGSNSMKAVVYCFSHFLPSFNHCDPHHLHSAAPSTWDSQGPHYPYYNPRNFIDFPTLYDISKPHLPYLSHAKGDPPSRNMDGISLFFETSRCGYYLIVTFLVLGDALP